tara:strand:+ start:3001 stop:3300 length:300 start_codon:yes stop_codon:yes gene_type:complete
MNLEQEFNKETGHNSYDTVNCHYTGHYVEWLESKLEAIKETSSKELKDDDIISFEEWKKVFLVKTEITDVYEFRGDFILKENLEIAYNKDVELAKSLVQ